MRIISRPAALRVAIVLVALGLAFGYMCRCGGKAQMANQPANISAENLKRHVVALAGAIGERNVWRPGTLTRAAEHIENTWRDQGYSVRRQTFTAAGQEIANLEVVRTGKDRPQEIIVVGAHYDTVEFSPGANDNGSGVAALLELSRHFAAVETARTIAFVTFVNEEPPFFETEQQGSRVYAVAARRLGNDIRGMLSLETMGYFSDAPGSQKYPRFFRWFYPNKGNFIGFVSDLKSRGLLNRMVKAFRANTDFPAECCATWSGVPGVGWSDHASFWAHGYRAIMVTDTAPYRYPHYHSELDTPDRLDYASLARVTAGLRGVVETLAAEP